MFMLKDWASLFQQYKVVLSFTLNLNKQLEHISAALHIALVVSALGLLPNVWISIQFNEKIFS